MEITVRKGSLPLALLLLAALFGSSSAAPLQGGTERGSADWQLLLSLGEALQEFEAPAESEGNDPPPWSLARGFESVCAVSQHRDQSGPQPFRALGPQLDQGAPRAPPLLR